MRKRLLSILLTVAMALSMFTVTSITASANEARAFVCGDADGNGSITIGDALEVLKYLAKLDSTILGRPSNVMNDRARLASTGFTRGGNSAAQAGDVTHRATATPHINDALEILKFLAKLDSYFRGRESVCHCEWCGTPQQGVAPSISTDSLQNGQVGIPYTANLSATGDAPITWSAPPAGQPGGLPNGLSLNPQTGVISGTPSTAGSFTFTVTAANGVNPNATREFTVVIAEAQVMTTPATPVVTTVTTTVATTPSGVVTTPVVTSPPTPGATTVTTQPSITTPAVTSPTTPGVTTVTTAGATTPAVTSPTTPGGTTPAVTTPGVTTVTTAGATTPSATTAATPGGTTPSATTPGVTTVTTTTAATTTTTVATTTTAGATTTAGTTTTREQTEAPPRNRLRFSHDPGLYTRGFELEITAPEGAEIWYTFSSANPGAYPNNVVSGATFPATALGRHEGGVSPVRMQRDDRGRWRSSGALDSRARRLADGETITVLLPSQRSAFTVSAVMVQDGVVSEPVTHSYIRGISGDNERYWANSDFMVFALYSDAQHFMDRTNGIFGLGLDRTQWIAAYIQIHPNRTEAQILAAMESHESQGAYPPTLPANFVRRGRGAAEVPVNLEMFDPHRNSQRVNQRMGVRVKGGWSRGTFVNEQKTLEFYAREGYGDRDNILFPMFGEDRNSLDGNLMHRYERFRLRNGGSDREQTYLRDEFAYTLAAQAGVIDTYDFRPAVVFLNGAYYGLCWMRTARTENHWRRLYQGNSREGGFEQIGSNEMGRASCGRHSCGRAILNGPADQRTTLPAGGSIPERAGPVVCTDARPCNTTGNATTFPCSWYWASFNDHCETLGHCRGTWRTYRAAIAPGIGGSGSWEEVVRLATNTPMDAARISSEQIATPNGLENAANWARFQEIVCVDDLMRYYALNIFGANVDWPSNNVEMWRYYLNDRERAEIAAGTSTLHPNLRDEKWRFVAHDMEMGWGIWQAGSPVPSATHQNDNTIWALMNRPGSRRVTPELGGRVHYNATATTSFMIPALMRRPDMRAKLANAISDLVESSHSATNAARELTRMTTMIEIEHRIMLSANGTAFRRISELNRGGLTSAGPGWPLATDIYATSGTESRATLTNFIANRPTSIQGHVQSSLGLSWSSRYSVGLTMSAQGGHVIMNNRPVGVHGLATTDPRSSRTATGRYFTGVAVPIKPVPWPGWRVASVSGATRVGTTNVWNVTAAATVNVTFERDPAADPRQIVEVDVRSDDQVIVIRNVSSSPVSMDNYFLTDDGTSNSPENLNKWQFPNGISIPANGTIRIGTRDNPTTTGYAAIVDTFVLDFGERLRLVRGALPNATIVQLVEVTRPERSQTQQMGVDGVWRINGPRSPYVPPHDPPCCSAHPDCNCVTGPIGGITAVWSETGVQISGIPDGEPWSTSAPIERWPPSGGPWGMPSGPTVSYANGVLTISGNGRHGWGDSWNVSWGYW